MARIPSFNRPYFDKTYDIPTGRFTAERFIVLSCQWPGDGTLLVTTDRPLVAGIAVFPIRYLKEWYMVLTDSEPNGSGFVCSFQEGVDTGRSFKEHIGGEFAYSIVSASRIKHQRDVVKSQIPEPLWREEDLVEPIIKW